MEDQNIRTSETYTHDYSTGLHTEPVHTEPKRSDAIKSMVFGILGTYFAWFPILSILGIIFGSVAKKKGTAIIEASPMSSATRNFAKAGRITGKVGLIGGIIMTAFYAFYILIIIAASNM